ncbi:early endosome antigen 1-like [Pomacea canaliculata]|uniref:early endosome antigen 1-like n=1 Tax=Pomacea canaliculata TaxID=400727 RepID=UPI000D7285B8|nr:early endosome antigen 1-like [Pomacea canaliculata]
MLRRLRKKDTGQPESPSSGSSRISLPSFMKSSRSQPEDISEAEGFLCPMCMKNMPSAEALQAHFEMDHSPGSEPSEADDQGEGFLCPMCKISLGSPEDLQTHYANCSMQTSFESTNSNALGSSVSESNAELELLQQQLRGSEESRTLLTSEVYHLQNQVSVLGEENKKLKKDKENIEQKTAKLAGEMAKVKAKADESEGEKAALQDHIKTLKQQLDDKDLLIRNMETQLSQRPGMDDVLVLKQELVQVQTLMDKMTQEREREKDVLEVENKQLLKTLAEMQVRVRELEAQVAQSPKIEEVQRLQAALSETASGSSSLEASLQQKEEEIQNITEERDMLKKQLENLQASAGDSQSAFTRLQQEYVALDEERRNLQNTLHSEQDRRQQLADDLAKASHLLISERRSEDRLVKLF